LKKSKKPAPKKPKTQKAKKPWVLKNYLISVLRKASRKTPAFSQAFNAAKEEFFISTKSGGKARRVRFKCAKCGRTFLNKIGSREIALDHIEPVISVTDGWVNWDTYIERLFCDASNLQILCNYKDLRDGVKSCHARKSIIENAQRPKKPKKPKTTRKKAPK